MNIIIILLAVIFASISSTQAAVFFEDSFETGDLTYVDATSGAAWGTWVCNDTTDDGTCITTENVRSGLYSMRFFFKGNPDLADDAWAEQRFTLGNEYDEVYIRFYIYYPNNYVIREATTAENTKLLLLWGDSYNDDMNKIAIEYEMDMKFGFKGKINAYPDHDLVCVGGATGWPRIFDKSLIGIDDIKGRWASIEVHHRRDTGPGDAIFQMWIDDVIVIDYQNVSFAGAPCGLNEFLRNGYLMGWSNSGFTDDTSVYIDDVTFSTTRIGGASSSGHRSMGTRQGTGSFR